MMTVPTDFLTDFIHAFTVLLGWPVAMLCGALIAASMADSILTVLRIVAAGRRRTREVTYDIDK